MSHIVRIETQVRDLQALSAACGRLQLPAPTLGTVKLFTSEATGYSVQLNGWIYPVVFDLTVGRAAYDNFGGRWGDVAQFQRLIQAYAVEKAKLEARKQGHTVSEQPLSDGSIKLTIQVAGGAA